jgi:GNAT superfamily N-acetyltransferase
MYVRVGSQVLAFTRGSPSRSGARRETAAMLIRDAQPADADEVAGVHVRSWQVAYRGLLPDVYLDGLRPADRARSYTLGTSDPDAPITIVADDHGLIRGFATTSPSRDPDRPASGELCALYVEPSSWGTGIGRALIAAARARLSGQHFADAVLWVLRGNERAARFYRSDGWLSDGSRREAEVWGIVVHEERYRRSLP